MAESNVTEMSAEQEQEARAADEVREEITNRGSVKPVLAGLVVWLVSKERLFSSNVGGDLKNAPERHPDVMLLKRLLPQSSFGLHVKLAWLCWRARQVRYFHPTHGSRTHTGSSVMSWSAALDSANYRDAAHDEAMQARNNFYADRPSADARREAAEAEEEALALTLMRLPSAKIRTAEVDIVPTTPQSIGDGKALQQQEITAAKEQERTEEKQMENIREGKPVNAGVKVRKPVQK